jgi:hypothetical protein
LVHWDQDNLAAARPLLVEAIRSVDSFAWRAELVGYQAELACLDLQLDVPDALFRMRDSVRKMEAIGNPRWNAIFGSWLAVGEGRLESRQVAWERLDRLREHSAGSETEGGLLERIARAHVEVMDAADHAARGEEATARALREGAERVVRELRGHFRAKRSLEMRAGLAWLERTLGLRFPTSATAEIDIRFGPECEWFQLLGQATVPVPRPLHRRLLRSLVDGRVKQPGVPLATKLLLEIGWPNEPASPGANRLYVELSRLRKLGLGPLIRRSSDGYFLDATVTVER